MSSSDMIAYGALAAVVLFAAWQFSRSRDPRVRGPLAPARPTFMVDLSPEEKQFRAAQFIQEKLGEGEARRTIHDLAEACGMRVEPVSMNPRTVVAPPIAAAAATTPDPNP